jgi:hypothetical protein
MSIEDWRIFLDSIRGQWRAEHRPSGEKVHDDTKAEAYDEVHEIERTPSSAS